MDWQAVTRIGDASVMLPVAAVVAVGLGLARSWRATGLWLVLVGTGLGVIVASKLAFLGWGIGSRALDFTGVSGHTLLATLVSAGAALAVLPGKAPAGDRLGVVAGAVTGAVIAASRLALHVHSISEVVSGWGLGLALALVFVRFGPAGARPGPLGRSAMAAAVAVLLAAGHGHEAPSQRLIVALALALSGHDRPFSRADWRPDVGTPPGRGAEEDDRAYRSRTRS